MSWHKQEGYELNPCPFCGSKDVHLWYSDNPYVDEGSMVKCSHCGLSARNCANDAVAVETWNHMRGKVGRIIEKCVNSKSERYCSFCKAEVTTVTQWSVIYYCPYCGAELDEDRRERREQK